MFNVSYIQDTSSCLCLLCSPEGITFNHTGGYYREATPVPIPNTEVKLTGVDNTWLATAREDRLLPVLYSSIAQSVERSAVNRNVTGSSPV